ncbi:MAG: antitoxin [Actinobacteria bacterium]|nr:antitoxin [Actinomycetota bacterium]
MSMPKTRRLQVLLEQEQWDRLEALARERGVTVAAVVREGIDLVVPLEREVREAAFRTVLQAAPMDVPEPDKLPSELEAIRARSG